MSVFTLNVVFSVGEDRLNLEKNFLIKISHRYFYTLYSIRRTAMLYKIIIERMNEWSQ